MWFAGKLAEHGIATAWPGRQPGAPAVRRRHGGRGAPRDARRRSRPGDVAALWRNLAELRALAEAARAELAPLVALLDGGPLAEVPLLAGDVHDLAGLDEIAATCSTGP